MPTTLPEPKPSPAVLLMQITRQYVGAALLLLALGLLWFCLYRASRAVGDVGKARIGG